MPGQDEKPDRRSWWLRIFGRSILRALVGDFFNSERNTASIIAIMLVGTLCYVVVAKGKYEYVNNLMNLVFAVIGYYFGTRSRVTGDEDEGS